MCRLSIVMPVYNTARFIKRSVDSVIAQTFSDWELLLIDDGSTDDSGSICDEYAAKDPRIKAIHKENGGAGSARNAGLDSARGEYVVFPDSDDWIDREAYDYCVKTMDENHLDLLVFGSINTVYDDQERVCKEQRGEIKPCILKTQKECREKWAELMKSYPMYGSSDKIYRLSIIRDHSIRFPDLRRMQDGVFTMRYYDCVSGFAAVDRYFYHFTMHPSDFQKKKIPKDFIKCAIVFHQTAISLLEKWKLKTEESERILGNWFTEIVILAQTDYLPKGEDVSFSDVYQHIKTINNNPYVHCFYQRYGQIHQLRKMEQAIKNRLNLLLTILAMRTY